MTKVCHISTVHHFGDPRIFHKQCRSLHNAGYQVYLINQYQQDEVVDGIEVKHLKKPSNRLKRLLLMVTAYRKALKTKAKVVHFHDPELMWMGVFLRLFGRKVVYDVHEDVPKQILDKTWLGPKWLRRIVSGAFVLNEKFCCLFFSAVVTATPEIAGNFKKSKTLVLHNYPIIHYLENVEAAALNKSNPCVIYAGGLTRLRGIYELIDSFSQADGSFELWLIGHWESEAFQKECEAHPAYQKHVKYFGAMSLKEVYAYYQISDVGVHLIHPIERYLLGIPTKILECMALGMPVVLTKSKYWESTFGQHIISTDPFDKESTYQALEQAIQKSLDKNERQSIKEFAVGNFSWEAEEKKLVNLYQKILS